MKLFKKLNVLALIAALCVLIGFTACDNVDDDTDEEEQLPKNQSEVITVSFDQNYSATVKGYLTDKEWAGLPEKVKTIYNYDFSGAFDEQKEIMKTAFAKGITIIFEKNPTEYDFYEVNYATNTIKINYAFYLLEGNQRIQGLNLEDAILYPVYQLGQ